MKQPNKAPVVALRKYQVHVMDPNQLSGSYFNPGTRTTPSALRELRQEILEMGEVLSPVHVMHQPDQGLNYVIVDGHRRCEVARQEQLQVPVRIHTAGSIEELWATLNRGNRKINQYEWLVVYTDTGHRVKPPSHTLALINEAISIYGGGAKGEQAVRQAFDQGCTSPNIISEVRLVHSTISRYPGLKAPSMRAICDWMIDMRMQDEAGRWTRDGASKAKAERMLKCIAAGKPLPSARKKTRKT